MPHIVSNTQHYQIVIHRFSSLNRGTNIATLSTKKTKANTVRLGYSLPFYLPFSHTLSLMSMQLAFALAFARWVNVLLLRAYCKDVHKPSCNCQDCTESRTAYKHMLSAFRGTPAPKRMQKATRGMPTKRNRAVESKATNPIAIRERVSHDVARIERMELMRSVKNVKPSQDQSQLVNILLHTEACDIVSHFVAMSTETLDDLFAKVMYHEVMQQLACAYSVEYESARMSGYRKQFATFIQSRQALRDGSTLEQSYTLRSNFTHAKHGSKVAALQLAPNDPRLVWNDPDEYTDYIALFDTYRDLRSDEEHEQRAEAWQRRNGL